jgi:Zn-dependent peptidase ImmA (M78 family)
MEMDEFTAITRARALVRKVNPTTPRAPMDAYVKAAGARLRIESDLGPDEPGYSTLVNGTHFICVNGNDPEPRRRFTVFHEIAHIVLGLPSEHGAMPWWSYAKRSPNEIYCDVFAAELLLPIHLFQPRVERVDISLAAISSLAEEFAASNMATGSRFAMAISAPCGFVLSEQGKVRYASRSKTLREANAWIPPGMTLPAGSLSARLRAGGTADGSEEIAADLWFDGWRRGGSLLEEGLHLKQWDQTLTLLWFADEEIPVRDIGSGEPEEEEEPLLRELDGVLPWPGKKRRR